MLFYVTSAVFSHSRHGGCFTCFGIYIALIRTSGKFREQHESAKQQLQLTDVSACCNGTEQTSKGPWQGCKLFSLTVDKDRTHYGETTFIWKPWHSTREIINKDPAVSKILLDRDQYRYKIVMYSLIHNLLWTYLKEVIRVEPHYNTLLNCLQAEISNITVNDKIDNWPLYKTFDIDVYVFNCWYL